MNRLYRKTAFIRADLEEVISLRRETALSPSLTSAKLPIALRGHIGDDEIRSQSELR